MLPKPSITIQDITGLILAGGQGARMGYVDKGLQTLRGTPLVQHVAERLAPQVGQIIINANQHLDAYRPFADSVVGVVSDLTPDFAGPLAGMQAGLTYCTTAYVLTVPCDTPFLPMDLAQRLADALHTTQADIVVASSTLNVDGDPSRVTYITQPVVCFMKSSVLPQLTAFIANGGRKVGAWHATMSVAEVRFDAATDDPDAFSNINTLQDLQRLEIV